MAILALTTDVYRFDDLTTCYPAADWHYATDVPAAVLASQSLPALSLIIAVIGEGGVWQPLELRPLLSAFTKGPLLMALPVGYSRRDFEGATAGLPEPLVPPALTLSRPLAASERQGWQAAIAAALAPPNPKDKKKRPPKAGGVASA